MAIRVSQVEKRERPEMLKGVHVRLLHGVLGFRLVAEDRPHRAIHALVVAAHDQLEEPTLACNDAGDDFPVGERIRGGQRGANGQHVSPLPEDRVARSQKVPGRAGEGAGGNLCRGGDS